nr:DNA-3-methyladenine glycosylase 2 family protein [Amycolatopsis panacis]
MASTSTPVWRDTERCYRAVTARDQRFDGQFIMAVRTTGIYCRPSCPALTPKAQNVRFYPTSAAAQAGGYRACRRCLPDAVPGSPDWNVRADLAARAMRLISDGLVERDGVPGLARRLGYSERQLGRVLTAELGAGPLALARAHRAHSARLLIEMSQLPLTDVAFAAGFSSVRQFNETIREVFATTPSQLRAASLHRGRRSEPSTATRLSLRLPFRAPFDVHGVLRYHASGALRGIEAFEGGTAVAGYGRTLRLPHGPGVFWTRPQPDHVRCDLTLTDLRDLGSAVTRIRRLLDLDADPEAVARVLAADPALAPLVTSTPGVRVPGAVDGSEILLRTLLGNSAARLVHLGEPLSLHLSAPTSDGLGEPATSAGDSIRPSSDSPVRCSEPTSPHLPELSSAEAAQATEPDSQSSVENGPGSPAVSGVAVSRADVSGAAVSRAAVPHAEVSESAISLAAASGAAVSRAAVSESAPRCARRSSGPPMDTLTTLFPTPEAVADADVSPLVRKVATALAEGSLDLHVGRDPDELRDDLLTTGVDPATTAYVVMRLLGAPDVLLSADPAVRRGADALGIDLATSARAWRPWSSYAGMYLRTLAIQAVRGEFS